MKWNEYNAAVSASSESARTDSPGRGNPAAPAAENKKPNRTRNNKITVYLSNAELDRSLRDGKRGLEQAQTRSRKLDEIIQRLYEDNIEGKISDERFAKMSATDNSKEKSA